jgi:DNA mismatch repair protein MSH6
MVKKEKGESTPAPPSLKKQASSAGSSKNGSILSFFSKAPNGTSNASTGVWKPNSEAKGVNALAKPPVPVKKPAFKKTSVKNMTPVPSSDAIGPSSSQEKENNGIPEEVEDTGLPSPATPAKRLAQEVNGNAVVLGSSPSRKVRYDLFLYHHHC